jgi:hypothetical protein
MLYILIKKQYSSNHEAKSLSQVKNTCSSNFFSYGKCYFTILPRAQHQRAAFRIANVHCLIFPQKHEIGQVRGCIVALLYCCKMLRFYCLVMYVSQN